MLLIFILVPILEIIVFINVGNFLGVINTIAIVIVTALIGTYLLQKQGLSVLLRAQDDINKGQAPISSVIDGVFLLIAGAFLLTPGLITDTFGFLLFIPQFRRFLAQYASQYFLKKGNVKFYEFSEEQRSYQHDYKQNDMDMSDNGPIIDTDYEDVSPSDKNNNKNNTSPWKHK